MAGTVWAVDTFIGYEGTFPVVDDLGCSVYVSAPNGSPAVIGWYELGDPRVDTTDKPTSDGTLDGPSTQPGRPVTIIGTVQAPDQINLLRWCDRFTGLLTSGDRTGTLTAQEPHVTRTLGVRRGGECVATPTSLTEASFSMILYGADPRRLGSSLAGSTLLPSVIGGLILPITLPFNLGSTVVTGEVALTNPGTAIGPVVLRIDGPTSGAALVAPIITHVASGRSIAFSSSQQLAVGEFLIIDMEGESILAQGQEPRDQYVTSRGWSYFDVGGNTWAFAAQSGSGLLTVTATPAW